MILAGVLLKLGSFGVFRVRILFKLRMLVNTLSLWLVFSTLGGFVTLIQSDLKKLIAYRRVTHMTFMIVGLSAGAQLSLRRVIMLSLAHGWASIGLFASAGALRQGRFSRLGFLVFSEGKFF